MGIDLSSAGFWSEEEALKEIRETILILENLPERAEEYADGCIETLTGIEETILDTGRVSHKQQAAIENIRSGAEKWDRS